MTPAVPDELKMEMNKPEVKETLKGPKAGNKPEVNKPEEKKPLKKPEKKNKETWAQRSAAQPPPKKLPEQRQQQQGEKKNQGDHFTEVQRQQQKKKEVQAVLPGQNSMAKRRLMFKRENSLPVFQKMGLDISSEVD